MKLIVEKMSTEQLIEDERWWKIYFESFDESIQTRRESIVKYHQQGSGSALRIYAKGATSDVTIGVATVLYLEEAQVAYLMYFAIDPEWTGKGAGTQLIKWIRQETNHYYASKGEASQGVLLEAEKPELAEDPTEKKRRSQRLLFYKKIGGQILSEKYVMPPVHKGKPSTPMNLVLLPEPEVDLSDPTLSDRLSSAIYKKCFPEYRP